MTFAIKLTLGLLAVFSASWFPIEAKIRDDFLPEPIREFFTSPVNETKIVGGFDVDITERPFQVSLQTRSGFHFCGGALVSENFVLSAAHCCRGQDNSIQIVVGVRNVRDNVPEENRFSVRRIILHPGYNDHTIENDICLIQLNSDIDVDRFGARVQKAVLATSTDSFAIRARVSGWGTVSSGGPTSNTLKMVEVPIVSDSACQSSYPNSITANSMICAGEEGKDSCQGDSGGPLTCNLARGSAHEEILCGIVSWGRGCALANYPGVYTEVAYFRQWVLDTMTRFKDVEQDEDDGFATHHLHSIEEHILEHIAEQEALYAEEVLEEKRKGHVNEDVDNTHEHEGHDVEEEHDLGVESTQQEHVK